MIEVVGIGAAGVSVLDPANRDRVLCAEVVIGSARVLASLPVDDTQIRRAWPSPLLAGLPGLLAEFSGRDLVVLATGDPMVSGIGSTLMDLVGSDQIRIHPSVSSVSLARARMCWPAESCEWVSLVSNPVLALRRYLTPQARLILLSAGAQTPADVARTLVDAGWPTAKITVLGDLGSVRESRFDAVASDWSGETMPTLNVIAVELPKHEPTAQAWGSSPGLPDGAYAHDGQISKREIRAAALAALRPMPGQLLWDLGAGSGSVGIEWALHHPTCRTIAVERDAQRAERILANAARLGITSLRVEHAELGDGSGVLDGLPVPDAVFIGGGLTVPVVHRTWAMLSDGGRLVLHAVTIDGEEVAIEAYRRYGGALRRISVERAELLGRYLSWRPGRAIVQWSATKGMPE